MCPRGDADCFIGGSGLGQKVSLVFEWRSWVYCGLYYRFTVIYIYKHLLGVRPEEDPNEQMNRCTIRVLEVEKLRILTCAYVSICLSNGR